MLPPLHLFGFRSDLRSFLVTRKEWPFVGFYENQKINRHKLLLASFYSPFPYLPPLDPVDLRIH